MTEKTKSPDELGAASCSLLVDCTEDTETFRARKPHNRFCAWKGRDFWHKNISVQVRLEADGSVFLSTQEGHISTLRIATISLEQLHALIRGITANNVEKQRLYEIRELELAIDKECAKSAGLERRLKSVVRGDVKWNAVRDVARMQVDVDCKTADTASFDLYEEAMRQLTERLKEELKVRG